MIIGTTFLVVGIIVILIWMLVELKRFKHKMYAIFIIILILFVYIGFTASIKGKDINLKSRDGLKTAGGLYLNWLTNVFSNTKTLTYNAIKMDWSAENKTG